MANTLSVIFPLYNEEKRLHFTFKDILKFNKKNIFSKVEYLFIDDGSEDESSLRIANFIKKNKRKNIKYRLIKLKSNSGKGYALKIGVEKSTLKWILTLDTDISVSLDQINIWQKNTICSLHHQIKFFLVQEVYLTQKLLTNFIESF